MRRSFADEFSWHGGLLKLAFEAADGVSGAGSNVSPGAIQDVSFHG
jgi:hypothetical protein